MSEIKVNKITPRVACGTTQLGDSGDTITIPSGATIQNLGTATGFGGTGVVSWDTASIKTTGFTAVTGTGYFCDTTGGAFTVTLPLSPSAGDVVGVSDYAKTFDTDNLTLGRNGSNIGGGAVNSVISTEGIAVTLVYVDGTKGWIVTDSGNQSEAPLPTYIAATGGCITTCGNYKMHTFLSPGTFCVSAVGNCSGGPNSVDYVIVAGAGGGGSNTPLADAGRGGGGGAGGYRESPGAETGYTASPLGAAPAAAIAVSVSPYSIVVGGGAADGIKIQGSCSTALGLTAAGGGGGGIGDTPVPQKTGGSGGSGGGAATSSGAGSAGTGNTPPTNPIQGNNSGGATESAPAYGAGGGGGAGGIGETGTGPKGGDGGVGTTSLINGAPTIRAGGGGGASYAAPPTGGLGGPGGGGKGGTFGCGTVAGVNGGTNTGGGGGGGGGPWVGGNGGSGVVIIRYKYQ